MTFLIKICGLTEAQGLAATVEAGADIAGLVLYDKSPRFLELAAACALAAPFRGRVEFSALTVDAGDDALEAAMAALRPEWLQLHGREDPTRARALKDRYQVKIIKALGIATAADLHAAADFAGIADLLLLDAKPPQDTERPGGHGVAFDWSALAGLKSATPFLLAGGLRPDNIAAAVATLGPARAESGFSGADISSGVERAPGLKDPSAVAAFTRTARAAFAALACA